MSKLDLEARMTIKTLVSKGVSHSEIARMLGVTEGAVRYQVKRIQAAAVDVGTRQ
jgi:IS30 family transposase